MNLDNLKLLPVWKQGASPADRFYELATIALKYPERFSKVAVIYEETLPNGNTQVRQISNGCDTTQLVGLLYLGIDRVLKDTSE